MAVPVVAFFLIFYYLPMFGLVISFKRFTPALGMFGSPGWVQVLRGLLPVLLRLPHHPQHDPAQRPEPDLGIPGADHPGAAHQRGALDSLQTHRAEPYLPAALHLPGGGCRAVAGVFAESRLFNDIRGWFGVEPISFFQDPRYFRSFYIGSDIWQGIGWGSIIYLAALSAIDPQLYEAATIDGANRFRQLWHVTLPSIAPTIVVLLILRLGHLMTVGHEKIILLYNSSIYETADVISTFVYRKGLLDFSWSYGTAVGLFNSLINLALVVAANAISRRVNDTSLW